MGFFSDFGKGLFGQKTNRSSTKTTMPGWLQDPAKDLVSQASELTSRPYNPYAGETVASFSPWQTQGYQQQADLATQGGPNYANASAQLGNTISGNYRPAATNANMDGRNPYAGSNPYLANQIDAQSQDVLRNYNMAAKPQLEASMVRSGSFGNAGLQQMQGEQQRNLASSIGDIANRFRFQDYGMQAQLGESERARQFSGGESQAQRDQGAYESERARQMAAIGMAPEFDAARYMDARMLQDAGAAGQSQEQKVLDDKFRRFTEEQQYPYQQLQFMQSVLNPMQNIYAGKSTVSTEMTPKSAQQGLGSMADIASMLMKLSDRRAKEDIKRVGKTDDGLNIYTYKYKGLPTTEMGVMAQEVQKKNPNAVGRMGGLLAVDYSKVK